MPSSSSSASSSLAPARMQVWRVSSSTLTLPRVLSFLARPMGYNVAKERGHTKGQRNVNKGMGFGSCSFRDSADCISSIEKKGGGGEMNLTCSSWLRMAHWEAHWIPVSQFFFLIILAMIYTFMIKAMNFHSTLIRQSGTGCIAVCLMRCLDV